jgi:hypothetical protein
MRNGRGLLPDARPLDRAAVLEVLAAVLDAVAGVEPGVEYRLVGTAAAVLRGVDLPTMDIDFLFKERRGVDLFSAAFSSATPAVCLMPPTWLPAAVQYFCRYVLSEVVVEFSTVEPPQAVASDAFECIGPGPWEHFDLVALGKHQVPVVGLELRLVTEVFRNRAERYRPLAAFIGEHGGDLALYTGG